MTKIVQTTQNLSHLKIYTFIAGVLCIVLFSSYVLSMYSVTKTAYAMSSQDQEEITYLETIAVLESRLHQASNQQTSSSHIKQAYQNQNTINTSYVSVIRSSYSLAVRDAAI